MELIFWLGGLILLLWVYFKIINIGVIEEKYDNLDEYNKPLPKPPSKSQIPENLYILKIDGKTTNPILLTDIPKFLVDADNTYVWDNEKLIWKHILLFDEIVNFCKIVAHYPLKWSTRNLDVDTFRNGDIIQEARTMKEWVAAGKNKTPAWCYYENDLDNGFRYGKLYNYFAVNDERGLAPKGYHIPKDSEWEDLENLLGKEAGTKLKSKNGWKDSGNGTDLIGFNALPGGLRYFDGSFLDIRKIAFFWSATEEDTSRVWYRGLNINFGGVYRNSNDKSVGASVRCIRD
jgi:uncharacterized protein (TIGR02145 family)